LRCLGDKDQIGQLQLVSRCPDVGKRDRFTGNQGPGSSNSWPHLKQTWYVRRLIQFCLRPTRRRRGALLTSTYACPNWRATISPVRDSHIPVPCRSLAAPTIEPSRTPQIWPRTGPWWT